jgi:hypothetical protein
MGLWGRSPDGGGRMGPGGGRRLRFSHGGGTWQSCFRHRMGRVRSCLLFLFFSTLGVSRRGRLWFCLCALLASYARLVHPVGLCGQVNAVI